MADDPRPPTPPPIYREITAKISKIAQLDQLIEAGKIEVLGRNISLDADTLEAFRQDHAALVKSIKGSVQAIKSSQGLQEI